MTIKIMTTKNEENRAYLRLQCPVCEDIMEIDYIKIKDISVVVCKCCRYIYPDLLILAKTIPPLIGLSGAYDIEKLTKEKQHGFYNAIKKKKEALLYVHCNNFDFFTGE